MSLKVITKANVVNHINESIGLSKRESQLFFETFLSIICENLKNKDDVKIVNFGIFKLRQKSPRIGRNPKTKEEVMISARNVVTFKSSEILINTVNSNSKKINESS